MAESYQENISLQLAAAAAVAAALGVRYKPRGTPINALCHVPSSSRTLSMSFRDPETPGGSLNVTCWAGCTRERARHALQETAQLPICRCRDCWERARGWPAPRTRTPAISTTAQPRPARNERRSVDPTALWRAAGGVPLDADHPARRWLATRHLWRPQLALPPTVRWLGKGDLPRRNTAAGALVLALARAGTRRLCAVHLVYVDAEGRPVPAWGGAEHNKNTDGGAVGAVGVLGALRGAAGVHVAEGLADMLAIHARHLEPAVAMLGTATYRNRDVARWLASFPQVWIWADPGRPGQDAAAALGHNATVEGGRAVVRQLGSGLDPGEAGAPLGDVDADELRRYTADLERDGYASWDAARVASIMVERRDV